MRLCPECFCSQRSLAGSSSNLVFSLICCSVAMHLLRSIFPSCTAGVDTPICCSGRISAAVVTTGSRPVRHSRIRQHSSAKVSQHTQLRNSQHTSKLAAQVSWCCPSAEGASGKLDDACMPLHVRTALQSLMSWRCCTGCPGSTNIDGCRGHWCR